MLNLQNINDQVYENGYKKIYTMQSAENVTINNNESMSILDKFK